MQTDLELYRVVKGGSGDSQEEVIIFRDTQTHMHHNIYITAITNATTNIIIIRIVITITKNKYQRHGKIAMTLRMFLETTPG